MLAVFDDAATLQHALRFEAELARAQATAGLVARDVAERIAQACSTMAIDPAELAEEAAHAGTVAIALLEQLRAALADDPAARAAIHHGATSQDLADTVLMLQASDACRILLADVARIILALAVLAERHAATPALGRTLLQDARPIPFGLRVAQWLDGVDRARRRLEREAAAGLRLQLGGPVGTLSGMNGKGTEVSRRTAAALGLGAPTAPWHAMRDGVAGLAGALGILIGALGKMARDVALLSQLDEAHEPRVDGRGGSSAMPGKRNATGAQVALSASIRAPGLVASILGGMPQELERGIGGWQAEAPVLRDLFLLAGGATSAMAEVAEGLDIDASAVAGNLAQASVGDDLGEGPAIVAAILAAHREID